MARLLKKLNLTPDTSLLEKIGIGNFSVAEAIAELIANSFDARIFHSKGDVEIANPIEIVVEVSDNRISVIDNGRGMSQDILNEALTLARDMDEVTGNTRSRMGLFGLGMKSASSSLGRSWAVTTKTVDMQRPIAVSVDLSEFAGQKDWSSGVYELEAKDENPLGDRDHGTAVVISNLRHDSPSEGPVLELLGTAYKPLLDSNNVISVNGTVVVPRPYDLIEGSRIEFDIDIDGKKWKISGWGGLDKKTHNDGNYGFQLYRKNQLIEPWNKDFFRAHLMTSRLVGELHLDFVPTNYTKKGFHKESNEWKAARAALKEELKTLTKASSQMATGKKDPMRQAKAIAGLQKAAGNAPRVDLSDQWGNQVQASAEAPIQDSLEKSDNTSISVDSNAIVIDNTRITLAYAFEDWDDETILWDYIYDETAFELQAVINSGSKLYASISDSKFLGTLALADVVVRFLMKEHSMNIDPATDIRDKWIIASVG